MCILPVDTLLNIFRYYDLSVMSSVHVSDRFPKIKVWMG